MTVKKLLIFDLVVIVSKKIGSKIRNFRTLTSFYKFKLKELKRKKINYVRTSLPSFTGARKKVVALGGGRRFPKTQSFQKRNFCVTVYLSIFILS